MQLRILEHWHGSELARYRDNKEQMLLAPIAHENVMNIMMAALLRPTARALLSTHQARAEDPMLGAAFVLELWCEAWMAETPLLAPCDRCNCPSGNWCTHCDDTSTPLCNHCDDNDHCRCHE